LIVSAAGAVVLAFVVAASVSALPFNKETHFRFSGSVALPGVVLAAGEYVFELADPNTTRTVVRVRTKDRSRVYLQALTRQVARNPATKSGTLTLGEAPSGTPRPILVWYPAEQSTGHQFIY
jgi:hypothetical protein